MIVLKFGGKSLGDKNKISKIAKYIKQRSLNDKLIVVVSAMADTTDKLLALAQSYTNKPNLRELDALLSCGEAVSTSLISLKLSSLGVKTYSMLGWQAGILAEGKFNEGVIYGIDKTPIEEKLKTYDCIVVAGFQGVNRDGDIITLGRGGSDTSAVALGTAFNAKVELYSDFNGIYAGDPRRGRYKKLNEIDFDMAYAYAESGAKVLSKSSAELAKTTKVDLVCKSSEKPTLSGTKIAKIPTPFVGISVKSNLCKITLISNKNVENRIKTIKFLLKNVNFYDISIANDKISILLDQDDLDIVEYNICKINSLLRENHNCV